MPVTDIYIFRHGETDWNQQTRFQGHTDIPLNEKGKNQALVLQRAFELIKPDVILTSDLSRALETAQIANQYLSKQIHIFSELRETMLGDPEGMLREDIIKKYGPEVIHLWQSVKNEHLDFSFPNGESKRQHQKRMIDCIYQFALQNPESKKIAVSSHGGSLRRVIHYCPNAPLEPIPIPNCSLYHVQLHRQKNHWSFIGQINY